ncbi:hypothetical protein M1K46_24075 [Fictibacillus sp. WQ 8-8]|uniref:hypothetical protein n=1 Tax=Fictibacillus sp. WQ 8-8 TaxID=2938788 RepID=UPI00210C854C|nr:hypothetical protein [Fictibacillus sp. WQ 8-8]MCQ6268658.1 hypothetical protein [Fictibacillus sp. WQ 8-8]
MRKRVEQVQDIAEEGRNECCELKDQTFNDTVEYEGNPSNHTMELVAYSGS